MLKEFRCKNRLPDTLKRCFAVAGASDGVRLFIKEKEVPGEPLMMVFNCFECKQKVRWESVNYKNTLIKKLK